MPGTFRVGLMGRTDGNCRLLGKKFPSLPRGIFLGGLAIGCTSPGI